MLRNLLLVILFFHGALHCMGFARAFGYENFAQLTKHIAKPVGLLWLFTALLFFIATVLFFTKNNVWWMVGIVAVMLSQFLIFSVWKEARFGTIANSIILLACLLSFGSWRFEKSYREDVASARQKTKTEADTIGEADLQHLPLPVQKYLRYVGVVGKQKVGCYKALFDGHMRDKGKDWFPFTSEQHNFTGEPTRLFFMKAKMFGITVPGYHHYKNGRAGMHIKLFGIFPMVSESGGVLNKAETVTIFNDMCILAPATLIDKSIQWKAINDTVAKATFTVRDESITAQLLFNVKGELTNFISDDRYAIADKKRYRFSTPVKDYKNFDGYNLPSYGEAIWHYPDGEFVYGQFHIKKIVYNVQ
ncbi:DUF6544 family protein [Flavisolibacter ginsenosidimutans]|uniref:Uncharacterized protein n=1 Tax=Flavisolibacter ginsenosidimutans TaxID=661481 RepID=A0A5B8UPF0_9BACT|nr:DUF6544 family protein [Flavisolibacter ginsenosidimutans]QEC57910.1 hypothetical protein FSB75_19035 [Flavisolibacter ginsenosidimutans]